MGSDNFKVVMGVTALSVILKVLFGLAVFTVIYSTVMKDHSSPHVETQFVAGGSPEMPEIPLGKNLPNPLLLKERALLSLQLKGALGRGTNGWGLRYNTREDGMALRPDLAQCLKIPFDQCYSVHDKHKAEVFFNGDMLLYVMPSYFHRDLFDPFDRDEAAALRELYPNKRWALTNPNFAIGDYLDKEWQNIEPWNGFALKRLENHAGKGAYFLNATIIGDGRIELEILTNAPLDVVKAQLADMDLDLFRAMVTPVPYEGLDTLEEYIAQDLENRIDPKKFPVLSDDALRAKVDAMRPAVRIGYAKELIYDSMRRNKSPFDYDVIYRPDGVAGLQDTRDFLSGLIPTDDPRYPVLAEEQRKRFAIGTCLQTKAGIFCADKAEDYRIAQELRRRAAAAQAETRPDETGAQPYSEEAFAQDMQQIERQLEVALQRLIQLQTGE